MKAMKWKFYSLAFVAGMSILTVLQLRRQQRQ